MIGKGRENIQEEAVVGIMSEFLSGDDGQADPELPEFIEQGGAAEHGARESVQPVDHNQVHPASPDQR